MGGIAVIARQAGWRVTGCDANVYPPMSEQLKALDVELIEGYGEDQLGINPDLWVVGNAIARGNPLAEAILDRGDRYQSGPEWLRDNILMDKWVLAIAGTHGKTTTSAMLVSILERAGKLPGFLIGGVPSEFSVSARLTSSDVFVIEADEYDTAFFDKRSKFIHYRPKTAVLNNLEFDHADIFADLADIELQFRHFVRVIPHSGLIISNGKDQAIKRVLAHGAWTPIETFGVPGGLIAGVPDQDGQFDILCGDKSLGRIRWTLNGEHNRMNAVAAIAAARHAGVEPQAAAEALSRFQGVRRRMELRGIKDGVAVYDDFAHHPTAIRCTVEGLRAKVGSARILAVLEPRSNTMKLGVMKEALPASLAQADLVYFYGHSLGWDPAPVFRAAGRKMHCAPEIDALVQAVVREARPGDHVLVMSNGGFGGIHEKLLAALAGRKRR